MAKEINMANKYPAKVTNAVITDTPGLNVEMNLKEIISRYKTEKVSKAIRKQRLIDRIKNYHQNYKTPPV